MNLTDKVIWTLNSFFQISFSNVKNVSVPFLVQLHKILLLGFLRKKNREKLKMHGKTSWKMNLIPPIRFEIKSNYFRYNGDIKRIWLRANEKSPMKCRGGTNPSAISTSWRVGFARHQDLINSLCFLKHTLGFSGCRFHAAQHKEPLH